MTRKIIGAAGMLIVVATTNAWAGETEDAENARELAKALQEHMVATYSCQKYQGGVAYYRAAKLLAVETYTRLTRDRNQAVLAIDRVEQKIKETKADERLEAQFKKDNLSYVDGVGACQTLTAESGDKVALLRAKLNLL